MNNRVHITELALRDGHQSLLATRFTLDDMLPIAEAIDAVGYWSVESWGGATFDACIRFLGEDPWVRIRELSKAMPNTPQQMLLRGQNLLGYRHYADDLVGKFVERARINGVSVFRIFDALNDARNLEAAVAAVKKQDGHAQGSLSFTTSPLHNQQYWVDLAKRIEDMGVDSIAIKDMAGLLEPYPAYDLVKALKQSVQVPIHLHSHATTGLAPITLIKAIEAGIDGVDTAISSLSGTYSHSATETIVDALRGTEWESAITLDSLEPIATHFRKVRDKYPHLEGSLKGVDARILSAQVPGGMLTNLESQLKQQNALDKFDELLTEIPRVRKDLGYIPLVTPSSQIVGTQAVLNLLSGEPYTNLSRETQALIRGEYGATPAPVAEFLRKKVLGDTQPSQERPADALGEELPTLLSEFTDVIAKEQLDCDPKAIDDQLTYAMFRDTAIYFLRNRGDASAFEQPVAEEPPRSMPFIDDTGYGTYTVQVAGQHYEVAVRSSTGEAPANVEPGAQAPQTAPAEAAAPAPTGGATIASPLAGTVIKVLVEPGQQIAEGDVVCMLEAMKMETEVRSQHAGKVASVAVKSGDQVPASAVLIHLQ